MIHMKYLSANVNTLEKDGRTKEQNWRDRACPQLLSLILKSWHVKEPCAGWVPAGQQHLWLRRQRPLHRTASSLISQLIIQSPHLAVLMPCFPHFSTEEINVKSVLCISHWLYFILIYTFLSLSFWGKWHMVWFSDLCPWNSLFSVRSLNPREVHDRCLCPLHVILYPVTFISSWNHVLLILLQIRKWIAPQSIWHHWIFNGCDMEIKCF